MCIKAECPQAGTRARWCTQSHAEADGIAEEEQLGGSNKCHCLLKGKGHLQIHKAVSAFVGHSVRSALVRAGSEALPESHLWEETAGLGWGSSR